MKITSLDDVSTDKLTIVYPYVHVMKKMKKLPLQIVLGILLSTVTGYLIRVNPAEAATFKILNDTLTLSPGTGGENYPVIGTESTSVYGALEGAINIEYTRNNNESKDWSLFPSQSSVLSQSNVPNVVIAGFKDFVLANDKGIISLPVLGETETYDYKQGRYATSYNITLRAFDKIQMTSIAVEGTRSGKNTWSIIAPVPEPLTILGSGTALAIGIVLKKRYSKEKSLI